MILLEGDIGLLRFPSLVVLTSSKSEMSSSSLANVGVLGDCFTATNAEDNCDDAMVLRGEGKKGPGAPKAVITAGAMVATSAAVELGPFEA